MSGLSCYFNVSGTDVWNPSNSVAELYVGQVHGIAGLFGGESGVGDIVDDECAITLGEFAGFTEELCRRYLGSNNPALRSLEKGAVLISVALLERAGGHGGRESVSTVWEQHRDELLCLLGSMPEG